MKTLRHQARERFFEVSDVYCTLNQMFGVDQIAFANERKMTGSSPLWLLYMLWSEIFQAHDRLWKNACEARMALIAAGKVHI